MVIVIFAVVSCTITFFIKTYLLSPFLIIFWWLGTFCDHVIFRSTSKAFTKRTIQITVRRNINRTRFPLFLSNPFEIFPQNDYYLYNMCTLPEQSVLSHCVH